MHMQIDYIFFRRIHLCLEQRRDELCLRQTIQKSAAIWPP